MGEGLQGVTTATEERALKLLGAGVSPEQVAAAIGVTPSRISQLLASESFAAQVADLKYKNLLSHSERDSRLDTVEDRLLDKIESLLPLIMRPLEAVKALQVVNGAKRRGSQGLQGASAAASVVQIAVPVQITQKFVTNIQNQVIQAGEQQLLTIQSGTLLNNLKTENPDLVQQLQDSNAATHSFNSVQGDSNGGTGLQRIGANTAGNCGQAIAGGKQEESRPSASINFIPVGS